MDKEAEIKNIGFEISKPDIDLVNGEVIGSVSGKHVGQLGELEISIKGKFSALPFINKGIDFIEKKIPGDQSVLAASLKGLVASIKF